MTKKIVFCIFLFFLLISDAVIFPIKAQPFSISSHTVTIISSDTSTIRKRLHLNALDTAGISRLASALVERYADMGYPFASLVVDSLVPSRGGGLAMYSTLRTRALYRIGSVYMAGGSPLKPYLMYSALDIKPGGIYSERAFRMADRRLANTGLVDIIKPAEVEFGPTAADIYIFARRRRSNLAGASLALCRSASSMRYFLTGEANCLLSNNFGCGERLSLMWRGYGEQSQKLNLAALWPCIMATPVGGSLALDIHKQDTSCLSVAVRHGVLFRISHALDAIVFLDARRLSPSAPNLPGAVDARSRMYGLSLKYSQMVGMGSIGLEGSAEMGHRLGGGAGGTVEYYSIRGWGKKTLGRLLEWKLDARAAAYHTAQLLDVHEAMQIGGPASLRGFREGEMRATRLAMMCNTLRLNTRDALRLSAFHDWAAYGCNVAQGVQKGIAQDVGLGLGFRMGAARVDISWAIGMDGGRMRPLGDAKTFIITEFEF